MTLILTRSSRLVDTSIRDVPRASWRRRVFVQASAALLALTAAMAMPTLAQGAEAVQDGGFEASVDINTNPHWTTSSGANARFLEDSLAHSGSWFAALTNYAESGAPNYPWVQQSITIPERSTATLTYWRLFGGTSRGGPLFVSIDGVVVHEVENNDPDFAWYQESVDISAFADGSSHVLRFERPWEVPYPMGEGEGVYLDDISVSRGPLPETPTEVKLNYKPERSLFRGTVNAEEGCAADRSVAIKRVKRGADPTIGRTTTGPDGSFRLRKDAKTGRYYAFAKTVDNPNVICLGDTSPRVKVG